MNDSEWIIGSSRTTSNDAFKEHAFLFDGTTMWDLNDLIETTSLGVTIVSAVDINNFGQIAATGLINGQTHALLLTPDSAPVPEPATLILFGAGLAGLAAARRRKKAC